MSYRLVYPQGVARAVTFSYDDGRAEDRRLVDIFNRCGLKGTFHLNSGLLDKPGYIHQCEVKELYMNHEIACHGVSHADLTLLQPEQLAHELLEDRRALERLTGGPVNGLSYAYGRYSDAVAARLGAFGLRYARTVEETHDFAPPADFTRWRPTCHHNDGLEKLADAFWQTPAQRMPLMFVWGHSFEFERQDNWEVIESFGRLLAGREDVWRTTCGAYREYLMAARALISDADERRLRNPSGVSVWIEAEGRTVEIPPGGEVTAE